MDDLKHKFNKQHFIYNETISLQQRYKIVIELCRINRLQNEETMSVIFFIKELNYLLSNYNNMIDHLILQMHKFKDEQKILKKVNSSYQVEKNGQKLNHEEIFSQIKQNLIKKKQFDSKVQESSVLIQDDNYLETSFLDITNKRNQIQSSHQQKFTLVSKDNVLLKLRNTRTTSTT